MGTTDEAANVALVLASDESRYVTRSESFVDGGVAQA
jgi:NAD(P)-dependent dehydrogenase (short-subunit alcohol dehydrogenase family)